MDRVGVDVLQLPKSRRGNKYAVVFMDYDQVAQYSTGSKCIHCCPLIGRRIHPSPRDTQRAAICGGCFLANLMMELYQLLGVQKLNTMAYHPQSDGLLERFNRTLLNMLAKSQLMI